MYLLHTFPDDLIMFYLKDVRLAFNSCVYTPAIMKMCINIGLGSFEFLYQGSFARINTILSLLL